MQTYSSYPNYINIGALIDAKIANNNQLILNEKSENISYLSSQINSHETRISNIENISPQKIKRETTEGEESSDDDIEDFEAEMEKKAFHEEVEIDTYLYLTLAFSFTSLHLFCGYCKIIFCKGDYTFSQRMNYLCTVRTSPLILLPGLATMVIQLYCVYYVYLEALEDFSAVDKFTNMALKIIILIIFLFMVAKEVSQSINSFFFGLTKAQEKKYFFYSGCFLPSFIQGAMGFIILKVGFLLIASTDDPINLIQNFASVYVLLEIDNIMMDFIKMSKLSLCISSMNRKLDLLREELGAVSIFKKNLMAKLMVEDSLDFSYHDKPHTYRMAFLITRTVVLGFLLLFAIGVYLIEVVFSDTKS